MNDTELAQLVRDRARDLNAAIREAEAAGLAVDLSTPATQRLSSPRPVYQVAVVVTKPV